MAQRIVQVDAFTDRAFSGNPAAVCVLSEPADEGWMQAVAQEMNLSETAFLYPLEDGFNLRWFTPAVEVDLCGHATLASAHVLWEDGHIGPGEQARFHTKSGLLSAERDGNWIEMDFPSEPAQEHQEVPEISRALDVTPIYTGRNRFDYLIEVESEAIVRGLHPDFTLLAHVNARGVIVTSRAESGGYDVVSRFFGPAVGIDEDPVTGSAHCCLAPYWAPRLGKEEFLAYQASSRGGMVRVRLAGNRVGLGGQAVTTLRGELV